MDWGNIAEIITTLTVGGGLIALVTIRDKKTEAILNNMQKVIDEQRGLAEAYKKDVTDLKHDIAEKEEKDKEKEKYIRELHQQNSDLYDKLDKANSRAAVNKLLKCQEVGCSQRRPPLGEGAAETFKQIRQGNIGEEGNGDNQ